MPRSRSAEEDFGDIADPFRPNGIAPWVAWIPFGLVVLSLVALLLVPFVLRQATDARWEEISTEVSPARSDLGEVRLTLALEISAIRGYLLTGEEQFLRDFRAQLEDDEAAMDRLRERAAQLHPEVMERVDELSVLRERWRDPTEDFVAGRLSESEYVNRIPRQQALLREVLAASVRVDDAIVDVEQALRSDIQRYERTGIIVTALLALLALGSAVIVGWLNRRLRLLARLLRYRAEEEAALHEVARALSGAISVEEVVKQAADSAVSSTRASGAYIERVESDGEAVQVVAAAGSGVPALGLRLPPPGSLPEDLLEARAPELFASPGDIGRSMAPHLEKSCADCSGLIVPLRSARRLLGSLVLLRTPGKPPFGAKELRQAAALGDLTSAALRRVRLLEEAERRAAELTSIIHSIPDAIFIGTGERIGLANQPALEMLGFPTLEALNRDGSTPDELLDIRDPVSGEAIPPGETPYARALRGKPTARELLIRAADGDEDRYVRAAAAPVEVDGRIIGAVAISSDLTERKRVEEEREHLLAREIEARAEAEEAVRGRDDVLAVVSHDLRNPLNTISMSASTLKEMELSDEQQARQLEIILRAGNQMKRLIQDLLDVSRLERGRELNLERSSVEVPSLVREVCDAFRAQAEEKLLELVCDVAEPVQDVLADRDRLMQVFSNLVGNAVKFTPEGGRVAISAEQQGEFVRFEVADTGPGIPESQIPHLFESHWQERRTAHMGAGFGLRIARGIVRAHDGTIEVESQPGEGTTFRFTIPVQDPRSPSA